MRVLRTLFPVVAALCSIGFTYACTLNVETGGNVTYVFPASGLGRMPVADGKEITVGNRVFAVDDVSCITVCDTLEVFDNTVEITYGESGAAVIIPGNIACYVNASVSGAHVVIDQSADVSDSTCGEITYLLSGKSADGSLTLNGSYKATIQLCGLSLTNAKGGAALNIQNGKRIKLSAKNGTGNTLADAAGGSQKGCVDCKGHLELQGNGILTVSGNSAHAVFSKEYMEVKNLTLNVVHAAKDGLNCNQYFVMESGTLNISGVADDGVQVSFKDDADREEADTGNATISGGIITANVTGIASKGIKADGKITVSGGELTLTVTGNGKYDSAEASTKASAALSADSDVEISGGKLTLTASGSGGKGIKADGGFNMTSGTVTVATSGGLLAYSNGSVNHNYTGSTDRLNSALRSSPKGIKANGAVSIDGGSISVTTKGNGAEGIESKRTLTINAGDVFVQAYDDAINSASHMYIKGGNVTAIASANDGLDANGNLYISGGKVMAFGAGAPECGLDANEEGGYTVYLTGGTVLAVGGNNSVPSSSGTSRQAYATSSTSVKAGQQVSLKNSAGEVIASFTVPAEYTGSSSSGGGGWFAPRKMLPPPPPAADAPLVGGPGGPGGQQGGGFLISAPAMTSGQSYTLTVGTSTSTLTAK